MLAQKFLRCFTAENRCLARPRHRNSFPIDGRIYSRRDVVRYARARKGNNENIIRVITAHCGQACFYSYYTVLRREIWYHAILSRRYCERVIPKGVKKKKKSYDIAERGNRSKKTFYQDWPANQDRILLRRVCLRFAIFFFSLVCRRSRASSFTFYPARTVVRTLRLLHANQIVDGNKRGSNEPRVGHRFERCILTFYITFVSDKLLPTVL